MPVPTEEQHLAACAAINSLDPVQLMPLAPILPHRERLALRNRMIRHVVNVLVAERDVSATAASRVLATELSEPSETVRNNPTLSHWVRCIRDLLDRDALSGLSIYNAYKAGV